MDAHGIKLKVKELDLVSFITRILDFYSSSVLGSEIKIIRKLPAKKINNFYTDIEKLEEIIDNIMSNAIKFRNPKNGIITCVPAAPLRITNLLLFYLYTPASFPCL